MTKLEWIEIENFRGISHLTYEPKQINLLVGKNNSGKTSVLEAIYLILTGKWDSENKIIEFYDKLSYNVRLHADSAHLRSPKHEYILYNDIRKVPSEYQNRAMKLLEKQLVESLRTYDTSEKIVNNEVLVQKLKNYFIEKVGVDVSIYDEKINFKINYKANSFKDPERSIKELQSLLYEETETINEKELISTQFLIYMISEMMDPIQNEKIRSKELKSENVIFVTNSNKLSQDTFRDPAILLELDEFVLENNLVSNLKRLMEDTVAYQYDNDKIDFLPYSVHGTGFTVLLGILYRMKKATNGVLLIEEPENHLHPGYISVFVEQIIEVAKKLNIQIFMTTHSYDLIEELASYHDTNGEHKMIQISRIVNRNGIHELYHYTPEKAFNEMVNLKMDLRGT